MKPMKTGIMLPKGLQSGEIVRLISLAEDTGVEYVWTLGEPGRYDVFDLLSRVAGSTNRIILCPVVDPYTRGPVQIATRTADLSRDTGGRVVLGLTPGDRDVLEGLGVERRMPLATMRESTYVIRSLLEGGVVTYHGQAIQVDEASIEDPIDKALIYVEAPDQHMARVGGEVGDGALLSASNAQEIRESIPVFCGGCSTRQSFEIAAVACFSEDSCDREACVERARSLRVAGARQVVLRPPLDRVEECIQVIGGL